MEMSKLACAEQEHWIALATVQRLRRSKERLRKGNNLLTVAAPTFSLQSSYSTIWTIFARAGTFSRDVT